MTTAAALSIGNVPSSGSLSCEERDFMPLWEVVKAGCAEILADPYPKMNLHRLYHGVYRLASNPCTRVPVLVRGNQSERVQTKDMIAQQCLVLYYLLRELIREHIEKTVLVRLKATSTANDPRALVNVYVVEWRRLTESLRKIRTVFNYLNNHWHTLNMHGGTIFFNVIHIGLQHWADIVVAPLKEQLREVLVSPIFIANAAVNASQSKPHDDEDDNDNHNGAKGSDAALSDELRLLKDMLTALAELDQQVSKRIYVECFEEPMKDLVQRRYATLSQELFGALPLPQYLRRAHDLVSAEERRALQCMQKSTAATLRSVALEHLVVRHAAVIIPEAMAWVMGTARDWPTLALLHELLSHSTSAMETLRKHFTAVVAAHGRAQIAAVSPAVAIKTPASVIEAAVDAHRSLESVVRNVFHDSTEMSAALEDGTKAYLSNNQHCPTGDAGAARCASLLAKYFHALLCDAKGHATTASATSGLISSGNISAALHESVRLALVLFELIESRDVFQTVYQQLLMRRLLFAETDRAAEAHVITAVTALTTRDYTHRWKMMLSEAASFAPVTPTAGHRALKLRLDVVSHHYWPSGMEACKVGAFPAPVAAILEQCPEVAAQKALRRTLAWIPSVSSGQLEATVPGTRQKVLINGSCAQLHVLLLFEDTLVLPGAAIADSLAKALQMAGPHVTETLRSLVAAKLLQHAEAANQYTLTLDQALAAATSASSAGPGVKNLVDLNVQSLLFPPEATTGPGGAIIGIAGSTATAAGAQAVMDPRRKVALQAAIVKTLKAVGQCHYQALLERVTALVQALFVPSRADVKAEIEKLIDKEIVERDPNDASIFSFRRS